MIGKLVKSISGVFGGNKSERDYKAAWPIVGEINKHFATYETLSHDELRNKTNEFVERINEFLKDIDDEVVAINQSIASLPEDDIDQRDGFFLQIEKLEKKRDEELEKILETLLPEAFAVVKETARRLSINDQLEVEATEKDRLLATKKKNVVIQGDKAIYKNEWDAAGGLIKWNMVHYDVQLIGGMALHKGKIAEMATGEGKTLVSTLPAYLNALGKRGVHIVTVNDYLARRDCEWNGPLFEFLGLTVDCIDYHRPNSEERRNAYLADITYGTNNEFGFDYLRDNMVHSPEEMVQRKHHFAMVDEVDSVLIDDARTPLIISGPIPQGDKHEFYELKPQIQRVVDAQKRACNNFLVEARKLLDPLIKGTDITKENRKAGGLSLFRAYRGLPKSKPLIKFLGEPGIRALLTETENYYLQDQQREMPKADTELYFVIDEKNNQVELTEKGVELITSEGLDKEFFILPDLGIELNDLDKLELSDEERLSRKEEVVREYETKTDRIHTIQQLLRAYNLFDRDVEYVVMDNQVKIVDEQTGRILDGRRYSDGLHQAIEAKENVKVEAATQTYATITLQNYFRMFHKLCGMTGTAETEAGEFWEIYKLDVMVIPTNKNIIRKDHEDLIYKTKKEKYNAVIDEIVKLTAANRPVLVGTTSVEVSETLSRMLKLRNLKHNVLNAKQHQREAEIVAEAGNPGTVTIATNMAGRGTDIKLKPDVVAAGGLAILGTERHESRRVDRQLRGRAGRQGDPGTSQFFVALEDDLMRLFGADRAVKIMDKFGYKEGEVIQHSMMSKTIERNQKRMEQNNFGVRKRLLEYDDVMNQQRTVIYKRRRNALFGDRLNIDLFNMLYDWCEDLVSRTKQGDHYDDFQLELIRHMGVESEITRDEFNSTPENKLSENLFHELNDKYQEKTKKLKEHSLPIIENVFNEQGNKFINIAVPFTDGQRDFVVVTDLKKAVESKGAELIKSFEKNITLEIIDDEWKEHLRLLDDLKQSTATAVYEQKDPLVIYKRESIDLFTAMIAKMNTMVLSLLFKGEIEGQQGTLQQNAPAPRNEPKIQTSRVDRSMPESPQYISNNTEEYEDIPVPQSPIKGEIKVGRNDPCPCGSGKKYKSCHGS